MRILTSEMILGSEKAVVKDEGEEQEEDGELSLFPLGKHSPSPTVIIANCSSFFLTIYNISHMPHTQNSYQEISSQMSVGLVSLPTGMMKRFISMRMVN